MKSEKKSSTLDGVSESEKLEIFLNYMASDEWVLPVQSFIDYYCVVFATEEYHEHQDEKQRVYQEYKQIVSGNLNIFLHSGLGISQNELAVLLGLYQGNYVCLEYLLAVEDFEIFHDFMYETNIDLDCQALKRHQKKSRKPVQTEEQLLALAIKESEDMHKTSSKKKQMQEMTEDQMLQQALLLSRKDSDKRKSEQELEEEELQRAIRESEALEKERIVALKMRQQAKEQRKKDLISNQALEQQKLQEAYQDQQKQLELEQKEAEKKFAEDFAQKQRLLEEQQALKKLQEEQEARRLLMLSILKEQTEESERKVAQNQLKPVGLSQARPLVEYSKIPPKIDTGLSKPVNSQQIDQKQESLLERKLRLEANRDTFKQKKMSQTANFQSEEQKTEDVFRRTGMKQNESEADRKKRLNRCVNVLKQVKMGEKSEFKPIFGLDSDPRRIAFQKRESDEEDNQSDITEAEITVLNKGRSKAAWD